MVSAFFGTLIPLERAVAIGRCWAYLGPLVSGLGGVLLMLEVKGACAPILLALVTLGRVYARDMFWQ